MTENGFSRRDFAGLALGGLALLLGSSSTLARPVSNEKDANSLALLARDIRQKSVPGATSYKVSHAAGRSYVGAVFVDEKNPLEKRTLWTLAAGDDTSSVLYSYSVGGVVASHAVLRPDIVHADLPKSAPVRDYFPLRA